MTPLAPGAHPSPEEVDALLDPPGRVADGVVVEHVAGCSDCQEVAESLREVRQLLRAEAERTPPPPGDLAVRLDAALARASGERQGTVVPLRRDSADGVSGDRHASGRRPRGVPRWVAVAAGIAVLGGSAVTATQVVGGGGDAGGESVTAADGGADSSAESADQAPEAAAAPQPPVESGTNYVRSELPDQVGDLLDAPRGVQPGSSAPLGGEADEEGARPTDELLADPAGLQGCLEAIGAEGTTPLVVDLATFEDEEAAVLVLPSDEPGQAEVWVVARDCRPGADGLLEYQVVSTE